MHLRRTTPSRLAQAAALAAFAPGVALAQGPTSKPPPAGLAEAQDEFNAALRSLDTGGEADCVTLCRALSSLARATERLCNLTRGEPEPTVRRCTDARAKLKDATQKVHAACPECALAGQAPPSVSVEPKPPPPLEPGREEASTPKPAPASAPVAMGTTLSAEDVYLVDGVDGRGGLHVTVGLGLVRLALPPTFVKVYGEISPTRRFSTVLSFGLGNLPVKPDGRAGAFSFELQPRFYALGGSASTGAFVGATAAVASASGSSAIGSARAKAFDAPLLGAGLSVGPVVGAKLVFRSGLTLEAHGGANFVIANRPAGERRVVPNGDLVVGFTF